MTSRAMPPRLGRGIAALFDSSSEAPPDAGHADMTRNIPVELLEPGPYQPRDRVQTEAMDDLVRSIRARGVLQPLLARPHPGDAARFQIVAGERRWRAAQLAGLHEVPVLVRALSDVDALAAALVENLQRQDLNPMEEAEGYRRLADEFGMTQEQLADAVGKSRSHVANTLRLLNLPRTVQIELRTGALSAGHARALLAHPEPAKAALAVISQGLNVRQTEALVADASGREPRPMRPSASAAKDPDTTALERELTERVGLEVRITFNGRRGSVVIRYESLEQLDAIASRLSS